MTACLPDDPAYCFYPTADGDGAPPRIRILVEGLAFAIPTALIRLTADDGFMPCYQLDRATWTALAAHCLRAGAGGA